MIRLLRWSSCCVLLSLAACQSAPDAQHASPIAVQPAPTTGTIVVQ